MEVQREIQRRLKQKQRALETQLRAQYDAEAPQRDMLAQLNGDPGDLPIHASAAPPKYDACAFFDQPPLADAEGKVNAKAAIIEDLVSLCFRVERRPRPCQKNDLATSSSEGDTSDGDTSDPTSNRSARAPRAQWPSTSPSPVILFSVCTASATPACPST